MLFRTPVTPLFAGLSLDLFGGRLAEPAMAVLYAGSIVCWAAAARYFGARAALAVAAALLLYQGYALMFHELSSEPVFAAAFAVWGLLVVRASFGPTVGRFALVGLGVAVLALVRPGNTVLLAFGIVPLLVAGAWRARLQRTAAFAVAALLPLAAWSVHNGVRFDSWGLARGGNAIVPFYRAFITDHIISPENGERLTSAGGGDAASPPHARAVPLVRRHARPALRDGSFRVHEDLYLLSDQVFGWDSNYDILRGAGVEGVRAHPGIYARGVSRTIWDELSKAQFRTVSSGSDGTGGRREPPTVVIHGKRLPAPTEGEPIPAGQVVWISRPDQSIRQVWTSPTEWHFEFDASAGPRALQRDRARDGRPLRSAARTVTGTPSSRSGSTSSRAGSPGPGCGSCSGLIAIALRRPRGWPILVALSLAAFAVVVLNALGLFADLHFLLPVAPAFVLLGLGGLLGRRTVAPPRT